MRSVGVAALTRPSAVLLAAGATATLSLALVWTVWTTMRNEYLSLGMYNSILLTFNDAIDQELARIRSRSRVRMKCHLGFQSG